EINLDYRATNRIPKYLVIVCSASKYGDYFTGGSGSVFYLDHLWLEWDYAQ
ncbi:MAG: PCMD domain-containing protein, partial [Muribaculaceae bacterium]